MSDEAIPVLLTVEEAGTLLRIGRTKAYAMAREWRETHGRSGLPVIDLGHVLRVPRQALEDLIGADLSDVIGDSRVEGTKRAVLPADPPSSRTNESSETKPVQLSTTTPRTRRRQNRIANQLDLFDSQPRST